MQRIVGATRYEFLMQVRRPSLWIGMAFFTPILFVFQQSALKSCYKSVIGCLNLSVTDALVYWALIINFLVVIGVGLLMADRFPRDCRLRVDEILQTIDGTPSARIFGKYFGVVLATLLPLLIIYGVGVGLILARYHDVSAVAISLATMMVITLPAVLFVGAFSIACTTLLWAPLYQFLFVGYWLWNSLNPTESIPTLSGTLISPAGFYALHGVFHAQGYEGYANGATAFLAVLNIGIILALAALALIAAWRLLIWREQHQ